MAWFGYGFDMVLACFVYGFGMDLAWFGYGFGMVFAWFGYGAWRLHGDCMATCVTPRLPKQSTERSTVSHCLADPSLPLDSWLHWRNKRLGT